MQISQSKKDKISEQIIAFLYSIHPRLIFTSHIAQEVARDEEFTKKILLELKEKKLVFCINKNPKGIKYKIRLRWTLSDTAYKIYKENQDKHYIQLY